MRDRPSKADAHKAAGLKPGQVTHHVDENKANNAPANLVAKDRGAHTAEHNQGRGLSKLRKALRMVKEKRKTY